LDEKYKPSTSEDESKGIDGYIGSCSISVKPITYKEKERISREYPSGDVVIFYEKDQENNIQIIQLESLSEKGNELINKIKR